MAAQITRSFGREAVAVYLAAALVVLGTWTASRYLILRKFENIEQNDVARSIEVMRKALVAKNTEIETVSRDFARWDDMYSYVSSLDQNFEYQNFSEAGLDEMNVDLVWLLDSKEKLISSFENDTDDSRYHHPASDTVTTEINRLTPLVRTVLDQEGTLRLLQINGVTHVIAAHTILHSDRSGPAAGTLVFARRIGAPEIASIGADTQLNVHFALLGDRSVADDRQELLAASDGRRIVRRSENLIEGQLRLDSLGNHPLAVLYTPLQRSVMQSGQQGVRYLVVLVALLVSIVVAAWHAYRGRLKRSADAAATSETRYRAIFDRAASGIVLFDPSSRRVLDANPQAQRLVGASLDELRRRDVATIFDTPVSLAPGSERDEPAESRPAQILRGDDERRDVEFSIADLEHGTGRIHAMILQDVSHRREAERRAQEHQLSLQHLATHDALTGLPNRTFSTRSCRGSSTRRRDAAIRCPSFTSTATTSRTSTIHVAIRSATTIFVRSREDCAIRSPARISWCAWAATNSSWSRVITASSRTARRSPNAWPRRSRSRCASVKPPTPPPPASACRSIRATPPR